ncbi:MAG: hypothetical protein N3A54_01700 [Patescibacteria group bacterium]|nr:hypothetical protein [Patescibacteria group bacterium]
MDESRSKESLTFNIEDVVRIYTNTFKMFHKISNFLVEVHIVDDNYKVVGCDLRTLFMELYKSRENSERYNKINESLKVLLRSSQEATYIYLLGRVFDYEKKICSISFFSKFNGFGDRDNPTKFSFNSVEEIDESNSRPILYITYTVSNAIEVFGDYDDDYKKKIERVVDRALHKSLYNFLDFNKFHKWHYEITGKSFFEFSNSDYDDMIKEYQDKDSFIIMDAPNKETIH